MKMTKLELIQTKMGLLSDEVLNLQWEYLNELALDSNVNEMEARMFSSQVGVEITKTSTWDGDWVGDTTLMLGNREWTVSGCALYGIVRFEEKSKKFTIKELEEIKKEALYELEDLESLDKWPDDHELKIEKILKKYDKIDLIMNSVNFD